MICVTCRAAADATPDGLTDFDSVVQALHEKCKGGTWCDCQHRKPRVSITLPEQAMILLTSSNLTWNESKDAGQIIHKIVGYE